jgi:hypothetical protein
MVPATSGSEIDRAQVVRDYLSAQEIDYEELSPGVFSFGLPGEKKLQTPVRLDIGPHSVSIHAFVCRKPDDQHERVYRWLLERNLRLFGVAFAVDRLGDIYLDDSFNAILELGFEGSIRKEWEWRKLRGESTRNLEAFRGWLEAGERPTPSEQPSPPDPTA